VKQEKKLNLIWGKTDVCPEGNISVPKTEIYGAHVLKKEEEENRGPQFRGIFKGHRIMKHV